MADSVLYPRPEAVHGPWSEALDHHVGLGRQLAGQSAAVPTFQVQRDRSLVGVEMEEGAALFPVRLVLRKRTDVAGAVTRSRTLDLDHVGPVVRQQLRAVRPGDVVREVERLDAGQGHLCQI